MILYHGSTENIDRPAVLPSASGRDFGAGFYCTNIKNQAEKWALRQARIRKKNAVLNIYDFDEAALQKLNCKIFGDYALEWLEMIISCRKNFSYIHGYDIVYGKIANDDVGETVQAVISGLTPPDYALKKLAFMQANNQYCFCTQRSLAFIKHIKSVKTD